MPIGWRIFKTKYEAMPFDGEGARLFGGRWTSSGKQAVYLADSPALATLEILAHLQSSATLAHYSLVSVTFQDARITVIDPTRLPSEWRTHPAPPELQDLGDGWLTNQSSLVLQIPTVIVPQHHNYILNPAHPDFSTLVMGIPQSYHFDSRLRSKQRPPN